MLLPTGRIDLTVGKPVDEVTADQADDGEKHAAPDGGAFVPVTWEHDPFGEGAVPVNVMGADPQEADVVLRSGDTTADLGSPYQLAGDQGTTDTGVGTMYVAVDGDGKSPTFEVTYDGLTQTVDPATGDRDAGAAEPLYAEPTMGIEAPCTSEGFTSGPVQPDISCLVNAPQRTPYLPGQGWAEDGHTWLLVERRHHAVRRRRRPDGVRRPVGPAEAHRERRRPAGGRRAVRECGAAAHRGPRHLGVRRGRRGREHPGDRARPGAREDLRTRGRRHGR